MCGSQSFLEVFGVGANPPGLVEGWAFVEDFGFLCGTLFAFTDYEIRPRCSWVPGCPFGLAPRSLSLSLQLPFFMLPHHDPRHALCTWLGLSERAGRFLILACK